MKIKLKLSNQKPEPHRECLLLINNGCKKGEHFAIDEARKERSEEDDWQWLDNYKANVIGWKYNDTPTIDTA